MNEPVKFGTIDEEQTWDAFAAAAIEGLTSQLGEDAIVMPRRLTVSAARMADLLLLQRRIRQG